MAVLTADLQRKYDSLIELISTLERVVVAFSGGLDSAFVLYASLESLGSDNVLAVTGDSASLALFEKECAARFTRSLDIRKRHLIIDTDELQDEGYVANTSDRCFYCKNKLYSKLVDIANQKGFNCVIDGCNASDIGDHRPGRRAAEEFSVKSPLLEVGLHKPEIREIARHKGLEIWDKPQTACLASRIPYGEIVTADKLSMIEKAEAFLRESGFRQLRVRHHGKIARIELEEQGYELMADAEIRKRIVDRFRDIGFTWISVDLKPFETGSMNISIKDSESD
jgi:uncharacterized protein